MPTSNFPHDAASPAELLRRQEAVALADPEHLRRWLQATDRTFLVLHGPDLVLSLETITSERGDPVGLQALQQIVNAYRGHRLTQPTGDTRRERVRAPDGTESDVDVPVMKDDTLTVPELDQAIRQLCRQMYDLNPGWSLESDPL